MSRKKNQSNPSKLWTIAMGKKSKKKRTASAGGCSRAAAAGKKPSSQGMTNGTGSANANATVGFGGCSDDSLNSDNLRFCLALAADKKNPEAKRLLQIVNKANKTDRELLDITKEYFPFKQDDKWNKLRVTYFLHFYGHMYGKLQQWEYGKPVPVTDTDKNFLRGIIRSETEPAFFVAHAIAINGFIKFKLEHNVDKYLQALSRLIAVWDSAKDEDNACVLPILYDDADLKIAPKTAGEFLMVLRITAEASCSMFLIAKWDSNKFVKAVSAIPGDQCDCCGSQEKSIHEMGVCGRCRVTYYCSKECQQKHWQQVHWKLCRKKGEFRRGDEVITLEPFASVGFGEHCRIVSRAPDRTRGLWNVAEMEGEETCIISAEKLRVDSWVVRGFMDEVEVLKRMAMGYQKAAENAKEDTGPPPESSSQVDLYVISLEKWD
ncbi:expressed unknown protein [Seminavis robusta]|uniref:MYND-type domain-containing protein n=1 Tax=Seminavis robusta TaxID=568900 RepID=A0A9N8E0Q1_9STRA|nr:expressed unknown protein [Seminavis robusta]|eukprot:Sro504_g155890.1 n/a (434) ;mRNA; f:2947-4248